MPKNYNSSFAYPSDGLFYAERRLYNMQVPRDQRDDFNLSGEDWRDFVLDRNSMENNDYPEEDYGLEYEDFKSGFNRDNMVKNQVFVNGLEYPKNDVHSLAEMFTEWFLLDSFQEKTVAQFLIENDLQDILTEDDFYALISGKVRVSEPLAWFLSTILPFTSNAILAFSAMLGRAPEISPNEEFLRSRSAERFKKNRDDKRERRRLRQLARYHKNMENWAFVLAHRASSSKYYYSNQADRLLYAKKYRKENRKLLSSRQKTWWKINGDRVNAERRAYRKEHPEEVRTREASCPSHQPEARRPRDRKYYRTHSKKINEKKRKKYKKNKKVISVSRKARRVKDKIENPSKLKDKSAQEAKWRADNAAHVSDYYKSYRTNNQDKVSDAKKKAYCAKKENYNANSDLNYSNSQVNVLSKLIHGENADLEKAKTLLIKLVARQEKIKIKYENVNTEKFLTKLLQINGVLQGISEQIQR